MALLFVGLMLGGTFALGASDVLKKKYLKDGLDDQALLTITLFLTGVLPVPVLLIVGIPEIKEGFWLAAATTILLNVISQNLFIRAFKLSDASLVAPLRLIIPPLVIVTGFVFLRETPSLIGTVGIFVTMVGLWFLLGGRKKDGQPVHQVWLKDRGVAYGLAGSLLFAISFPFDKITVVTSSAIFATCSVFSVLGLCTFAINVVRDRTFARKVFLSCTQHLTANVMVSVFSAVGIVMTNQALNYSLVAYASSLKRLQALWTVIIAGKFLQEKEMKRRVIATVIMFLGILLSVFWK
ncbi:hypothetical protein EPO33_04515 [Patescibacteria group bacterium]|nr:MAG: hypothetical protein EPO33_04515 [Patescibacteria group bacterium]